MKTLKEHISESLFTKHITMIYAYTPKTTDELKSIIKKRVRKEGNECDLNDIDVSNITDMDSLFFTCPNFNGNISEWDVSNVTNMSYMFYKSEFDGDISGWNVSSVTNMQYMFYGSEFNGDISEWDVSNVTDMTGMFMYSIFSNDISGWNVNRVTRFSDIYHKSRLDSRPQKQPKFK